MHPTFLCVLILRSEKPQQVAEWYRDVLGLPIEKRDHDYSCMLGNIHFSIHGLMENQSPTSNAELGIYVPNVDDFVKQLTARKIALADPIRDYPWARAAQIRDPLGNLVYLMQLPDSTLVELGIKT